MVPRLPIMPPSNLCDTKSPLMAGLHDDPPEILPDRNMAIFEASIWAHVLLRCVGNGDIKNLRSLRCHYHRYKQEC